MQWRNESVQTQKPIKYVYFIICLTFPASAGLKYIPIGKFEAIDQKCCVVFSLFIMWTNLMSPSMRFDSFSIRLTSKKWRRQGDMRLWFVRAFEKCSARSQKWRDETCISINGDCVSMNATKWTAHNWMNILFSPLIISIDFINIALHKFTFIFGW